MNRIQRELKLVVEKEGGKKVKTKKMMKTEKKTEGENKRDK